MGKKKAKRVNVKGGESNDVKQIRALLYKEQEGHIKGDVKQILSCYAPGFVGYRANTAGPELWQVGQVGLDALRKMVSQSTKAFERASEHPEWEFGNEVLHIDVKDGRAIALTQHYARISDPEAREVVFSQFKSTWMLAKNRGAWKITNFIGFVEGGQKVWKLLPE